MEEIFESIYYNKSHPASFGNAEKLFQYAKLKDDNITRKHVNNWLSSQTTYTLHKQARQNFKRNRIYVSYVNEQWEIDLVDLRIYSKENDGHNYLLNVIDCFSKYLYSIPTRTKTAIEIITCFKKLFKKSKPTKIRSDKGGEFDNRLFRAFCSRNDVIYFTTQNHTIKCAIVERVNRTLKGRIFRYFTHKGTRKYINVLQDIVKAYNDSIHRSTGMAPSEVDAEDEPIVFRNLYGEHNLKSLLMKDVKLKKFKPGDTVRQKYDIGSLEKSYYPMWTDMVYKIDKVYDKTNIPQYTIEIDGEKLNRRFYPEELQKVIINNQTLWLIEKVLAHRTKDGQRQVLIKWKNYPPKYNQWIPQDQIQNL